MNQKHLHKEQLGYEVPQGYFESSKKDMLSFLKEKETKNKIEILEAEKVRDVAAVDNDKKVREEETQARVQKIRADSEADQTRISADAESYAILKKAEEVGLIVKDFSVSGASLETVFLSMTSKK